MLRVGTLVGMRLRPSSSGSGSGSSPGSSLLNGRGRQDAEWKVTSPVEFLHGVTLLPPTGFVTGLISRMENHDPSLRSLVMDGMSLSQSMTRSEMESLFDALGRNASIRRLSIRYSGIDDDVASLLALALVDNTTLTQLHLGGNDMTILSAKSFFSVLQRMNKTLRLLDLGGNHPSIDDGVERELDQFMSQRALKLKLTNKAEKARRAARGMPPDPTLEDDDDDEDVDGRLTMVCPQSIIDEIFVDNSGVGGGGVNNRERIGNEGGMVAARGGGMISKINDLDICVGLEDPDANEPNPGENIREYLVEDGTSVVSLASDALDEQQVQLLYEGYKNSQRPNSLSSLVQKNISIGSSITAFSAENDDRSEQSNSPLLHPILRSASTSVASGRVSFQGHDSRASRSSSSDTSNNDFGRAINEKMKRATSNRVIGAQHIDEAAPGRQNRGDARRSRRRRSIGERRRRLAQLESEGAGVATSGGGDVAAAAAVGGGSEAFYDADVELAVSSLGDESQQSAPKKSRLSENKVITGFIALLIVGLLVLIILYLI